VLRRKHKEVVAAHNQNNNSPPFSINNVCDQFQVEGNSLSKLRFGRMGSASHDLIRLPGPLHSVLGSPFPCRTVVPHPVSFQELGNVGHKRIIWIGVREEGTNTEQHFANSEGRTPLILQNVEADSTIRVNVAVVDARSKMHLRGFEWVIGGKVNVEEEYTPRIGRFVGPHDSGLPVEHIIPYWSR
jgi:hypothetical protein